MGGEANKSLLFLERLPSGTLTHARFPAQISSGMLESRISGNTADGIMENTPRLLRSPPYCVSLPRDKVRISDEQRVCLQARLRSIVSRRGTSSYVLHRSIRRTRCACPHSTVARVFARSTAAPAHTIGVTTDSPLQVINLNIKKLVLDLYTTMKVPRKHNRYISATLWRPHKFWRAPSRAVRCR